MLRPTRATVIVGTLTTLALIVPACQSPKPWDIDEQVGYDYSTAPRATVDMAPDALEDADEPIVPDSDEPLTLSVEQAVFLTLQNNRALRIQQYEPQIAGQFEQIERSRFDPLLYTDLVYSRARTQQLSPEIGATFDTEREAVGADVGIRQRLPTGTELGAELSHDWLRSDRTPDDQHEARVGVSLTQALLRGRGRESNLAAIRQARLDTLASEYELRGFAEALVADLEVTYWSYVLARREIEIFDSSLEVAQQQQRETERRVEVGVLAETELAAARSEVALRREELINARNNAEVLRLQLLRLMNPGKPQWERQIDPIEEPTIIDVELDDVNDHVQLALRQRADLNEARLRLEQRRLDLVRTADGLLPRLDLFVTLGKTGFASAFGRAWEDLDGRGYDLAVGGQFEYALGNRAARADDRIARFSRQQASEAVGNVAELVQLDVRTAWLEVQRAREQIAATIATRELREETLRAEQEKFRVGTTTALLVAQAQRDLLESQIAEVRAVVTYRQALIDLYRLEGSLLLRRGVEAPGAQPRAFNGE
ncbi:TolC family protein [Phycisphaerales bacterium AB-hyl4]|uniref:TolC family protein n=1 Tax=Natronomicrosphaera hydrolytica TaxID=3242702 RepID=A0ABV4U9F2_9BACT